MFGAYIIIGLAACALLKTLYYRIFCSPLTSLPGPKFTILSSSWLIYKEFTGQRRKWLHQLHLQYGPIVRISPDEVSFASWDALKEIYITGGTGYDKTSFYDLFSNLGTRNMFSTLDRSTHADLKKRFVDKYNKSSIMQPNLVSVFRDRAEEFMAKCTENDSADIYIYLHCYSMDCGSHLLFYPYGIHSLTDPSDMPKVVELTFHDTLKSHYLQYYFPELMALKARIFKRTDRQYGPVALHVLNLVRTGTETDSSTVLHKLKTHKDSLDELYIASECMDHLVAAIDTTGDTLCILIHHLSLPTSYPIQQKLHEELVKSSPGDFDDLPYLDAVIKEALRCFGPSPMSLPRRVPSGGRTISGVFIPENTIVSCQSYTLHRLDTEVFPNPDEFLPERWLQSEGSTARNQLLFAFGAGGRMCIGKHLAMAEMKILLQEVYTSYRTKIAKNMTASMELVDQAIVARPAGQKCLITFEKYSN
ncbi:cytochrome P450 [Obba rivulosa]|uniref:Cytochrome P450 n=1 Tax=Obba rivulosa TaxID=1052685 RepID=A0A8E2AXJ8_9APHY|nr:cytochrome P450 [Obba rivulosa]